MPVARLSAWRRHPLATLAACGLGFEAVAAAMAWRYPLPEYYSVPLLDFGRLALPGDPYVLIGLWVAMWLAYLAALKVLPAGPSGKYLALVFGFAALISLTLLLKEPLGSTDVFAYVARGHFVVTYHTDPFLTTAASFPHDRFARYVYWRNEPDNYGVLWHLQTDLLSRLVGPSNLLADLIAYKLLVIGYFLATIPLVYRVLLRLDPGRSLRGTLFVAWNPLLLYGIASSGHNDALILFAMVLALFFLVEGHYSLSLLAVGGGVLIKFVPALLAPFVLIALARDPDLDRRHKLRSVALAAGAGALLTLLAYLPYGMSSIPASVHELQNRYGLFANSPSALLVWVLNTAAGIPQPTVLRWVAIAAAVLVADVTAVLCLHLARRQYGSRLELIRGTIAAAFEAYYVLLALASLWLWPWYLIWLFALAPFLQRGGYWARTLTFGFGMFIVYPMYGFWGRYLVTASNQTAMILVIVLVAFVPSLAISAWGWRCQLSDPARTRRAPAWLGAR